MYDIIFQILSIVDVIHSICKKQQLLGYSLLCGAKFLLLSDLQITNVKKNYSACMKILLNFTYTSLAIKLQHIAWCQCIALTT